MPTINASDQATIDRSAMRNLQFRQQQARYMMPPDISKVSSPKTTKVEIAATFNGRLRGSMQFHNSVGNRTAGNFHLN